VKKSYLPLIFAVTLLGACTSGTEKAQIARSTEDTSIKNAALAPGDRISAMCVGTVGCRFGDAQIGTDTYDPQLSNGLKSGDLKGSDLHGLSFSGAYPRLKAAMADLTEAKFGPGNFFESNLMDATLLNARFGGSSDSEFGTNFSNSNFAFAKLNGASFDRVDLSQAVMIYADLSRTTWTNVRVEGLDLSGAVLDGVNTYGLVGRPFLPDGWKLINGRLIGPGARFVSEDRVDSILAKTDQIGSARNGAGYNEMFIDARSSCPRLWNTNGTRRTDSDSKQPNDPATDALAAADLSYMDLRNTDFSDLNLSRTNFEGAKLDGARFIGANLSSANFKGASLNGNDFTGARLAGVLLRGATVSLLKSGCTDVDASTLNSLPNYQYLATDTPVRTSTPTGEIVTSYIRNGLLLGPNVDLRRKNLAGLTTTKVDLSMANLDGVRSGAINEAPIITPSLSVKAAIWPQGWTVRNGLLVGPKTDLSFANLSKMNFANGCEWLQSARLDGVISGQTQISSYCALPTGWAFANGFLVGPRVNLDSANLSGQKLDGARLVGVSLRNTSLIGASLVGVRGRDISGTPKLSNEWKLVDGTLFGPTADLTGVQANLTDREGLRLQGLQLSKAILTNSELSGLEKSASVPTGYKIVQSGGGTNIIGPDVVLPCSIRVSLTDLAKITLPRGAGVLDGQLIGPKCSFWSDKPSGNISGSLNNVDISDVTARGMNFSNVRFGKVKGVGVGIDLLPPTWAIRQGILVGPSADLTNVDLSRVDLRGIDLSGADLKGAYGRFVRIDAATKLPTGWGVVNNFLVGPGANLSKVLIVDGNFTSVSLRDANVVGARIYSSRGLDRTSLLQASVINGHVVYDGVDLACWSTDDAIKGALGSRGTFGKPTYVFNGRKARLSGPGQCG
jgi:uncharacterized protein YjbI with pentapeptide repeats